VTVLYRIVRQSGNRFGSNKMRQVIGLARIVFGETIPSPGKAR